LIKPVKDFFERDTYAGKYLSLFRTNNSSAISAITTKDLFGQFTGLVYEYELEKMLSDSQVINNNLFLKFDIQTSLVDEMLVKVDLASMLNSLEVRVPFLDHELIEFVSWLPFKSKIGKNGKQILKEAFRDEVPAEILRAPKRGFNLPLDTWIKLSWNKSFRDVFNDSLTNDLGIDKSALNKKFDIFCNSSQSGGKLFFYVFTLINWYNNFRLKKELT
jgi:asparagine synthase (glutamine-hydrolysing)